MNYSMKENKTQKVLIGSCHIGEEPMRMWGKPTRIWRIGGETRLKRNILKSIPGAIEDRWGMWDVPEDVFTPALRAQVADPVYAEPRADLVFTVKQDGMYVEATLQRDPEIVLVVHPAAFVIRGKMHVNRVWYTVSAEFSQVERHGITFWEYQDRYTRPEMTRAARFQIKQELAVIVASYLAQHDSTRQDAQRKRLQGLIQDAQKKLLELSNQMNAQHDLIAEYESALAELE